MPLIALNKNSNERIDITTYAQPLTQLKADDLACPLCESRMMVVSAVRNAHGQIQRIAHFRHHRINDCIYTAYSAGESEQHRAAKVWLREQLLKEAGWQVPVELEYHLPDVARIADVAQLFPTGWIVVHEIQLAAISILNLEARTRDYLMAGCDVIWYLGRDALTPTNLNWVREFQGFEAAMVWRGESDESDRFSSDNVGLVDSLAPAAPNGNGQAQRRTQ